MLILVCSCSKNTKTSEFYKSAISRSYAKADSVNISNVLADFKKGDFNKEERKIYKIIGDSVLWIHRPINRNDSKFLTFSNTYITYVKIYLRINDEIIELKEVNSAEFFPHKNLFYRHPTWELPKPFTHGDLFIELKNNSGRVRLEFFLEDHNEFLKRLQTEYFLFGACIIFLLVIASVLLFFALNRKKYSITFYVVYVICMIVELLAGEGLGVQYLWSDVRFLVSSGRTFAQTLSVLMIALFFYHFYDYKREQYLNKNIFKWCAIAILPFLAIYVYKMFIPSFENFYLFVWVSMKTIIIIFLINHLILARKKLIPIYLVFGFFIPPIAMLLYQNINPNINASWWQIEILPYMHYIALIIEILIFTYYIFKKIIDNQRSYEALQKTNESLKQNFQQEILDSQEDERDKLLADVHDSFGGYIAALRLRLEGIEDVNILKVLESFNKDYRYLLQNLYSPKINSNNFIETLVSYLKKMNELSGNRISFNFQINDLSLPKSTCIHLYRSISELVTNAIKHSQSNKISVNLFQEESDLILNVSDNGIGFSITDLNYGSFGLNNVKDRIKKINGKIEVNSGKYGTEIILKIPYE